MKLTELRARLLAPGDWWAEAGIAVPEPYLLFDCPCCPPGSHEYHVPLLPPGALETVGEQRRGWEHHSGDSVHNITLKPSIRSVHPKCWHGFVENGMVTFCADSAPMVPRNAQHGEADE